MTIKDPVSWDVSFTLPQIYNASSILFDNLVRNPQKIAILSAEGCLNYQELCNKASQIGNALKAEGLKQGDRVLCLLDDTPNYPAVIFGAMRAGFVPVLLNTQSPPDLIAYYAEDSQAKIAFSDMRIELQDIKIINDLVSYSQGFSTDCEQANTTRDDMAFWMYSSGSTGKPKGVVHLHHDMAFTVESYSKHILKLTSDDICFSVPKVFFAYGFGNSCTFPFAAGATSVLLPGRPDPATVYETVATYKPTVFFGLPTLYTALIKDETAEKANFSSVRLCLSAAEVLAAEVFNAWRDRFGLEIVEGLGSTEMLHIYLSNTESDKRLGSAGKAVPGYEIRLEEGVLLIRGHSSAPCYWNRPDKTIDTMRGEWIYTGDKFDLDADGFYYFRGRADDLIKVSGQWVYPLEVELCLADNPHVKECAVMAHELEDRRMTLRAFVVLQSETTTKELQNYVKKKLVPYKYPREVIYMQELPKTGTGKIDRQALKNL